MTTTLDEICRGELLLEQPRQGYRFNVDSVILASFVSRSLPAGGRVADLGAGVGIIGLLLARRWPTARVLLVELQPELASLAAANVARNRLAARVEVRQADLREVEAWAVHEPTVVVCNPPYLQLGTGRTSPRTQVARAKHELTCTLEELIIACGQGLTGGSQLGLIYPSKRSGELEAALAAAGFGLTRSRLVLPLPGASPRRILVLAERGAPQGLQVEQPPLLIEERPGHYTPEMAGMLGMG